MGVRARRSCRETLWMTAQHRKRLCPRQLAHLRPNTARGAPTSPPTPLCDTDASREARGGRAEGWGREEARPDARGGRVVAARARDQEASERRLDNDDADANASSFPLSTLPQEVLDVIFSLLDHDSAFQCAVVCRAWREVALAPDSAVARRLIADVVRANAGILAEADALAARAPETGHPDPLRGDALARWETCRARELRLLLAAREMTNSTTTTTTTSSPRQLYADVCAFACYDCREMRDALDPAPRAPRTTAGRSACVCA